MARKSTLSLDFSLIVILTLSGIFFANPGRADPFPFKIMDEVPPDDKTEPPAILILYPDNNTLHAGNNMVLSLTVEAGYSATAVVPLPYLLEIYYEADWQRGFYFCLRIR